MILNAAAIGRFKELWREQYGEELTDAQAREYGERLVGVVKVLVDPDMHHRGRAPP